MRILTFICLVGVVLATRTNHHNHHKVGVDPMTIAEELEAEAVDTIVGEETAAAFVNYAKAFDDMCGCGNFNNGGHGFAN